MYTCYYSISYIIIYCYSFCREKLFSLVKDSSQFTKLTHMNRTHLLSDSLVKFIDTSNSTSTKPGSTNTNPSSVGGVTGSVSSGMGLTQTTHESTSDTLAMKSTGSKSSGTGRAMNGSFYIPDAGIQSFGWSHNQLIDTLCHCTQIKPIEIASPVKNNSNSNPAGNGVAQSHDASKSNSHTHTDINSNDQSSHQSTLPVSPLPTSAIDSHSNNNSNEAFDMGTLRALAIERGKLQKTLQATLIRETEYQKQLSRLQSVIPIADEIQQIFNRLNRTSYVLIDIFQLLCNTALKRSQTEVSYIIQHILIKHTPEYFVIIARDNVCPQSSLHLNFNVKYSQIRSKLQSYVDSEKKDVLSKLQQLRLLSA